MWGEQSPLHSPPATKINMALHGHTPAERKKIKARNEIQSFKHGGEVKREKALAKLESGKFIEKAQKSQGRLVKAREKGKITGEKTGRTSFLGFGDISPFVSDKKRRRLGKAQRRVQKVGKLVEKSRTGVRLVK